MGEGLQIVARSLYPSHDLGLLPGIAPDTRHVYLITGLPQCKRHVTRIYAANSPAQRHNDHLAGCWRIADGRLDRRNCALTKFPKKEVRLKVCNRRLKKAACSLSFQIGHDLDTVILRLERTQRSDQVIAHSWIAAIADIDF